MLNVSVYSRCKVQGCRVHLDVQCDTAVRELLRNMAAELGGHAEAAAALAGKGSSGLVQLLEGTLPELASGQATAGANLWDYRVNS